MDYAPPSLQKQQYLSEVIEPRIDELLSGLHSIFNPRTIAEGEEIRKRHNIRIFEEFRPFTI